MYVAIDFCGPFTTYEGPKKQPQKCWVMVVSDLVTRFISVEVVTSMTTAAFINAFWAFVVAAQKTSSLIMGQIYMEEQRC